MHVILVPPPKTNPCDPSPCGPNSQCRVIGTQAACSCVPNYVGRPPSCRPECTQNSECASNRACKNEHCVDPCPGACGQNAQCIVVKHNAMCTCVPGFEGNPSTQCTPVPVTEHRKDFCAILLSFALTYSNLASISIKFQKSCYICLLILKFIQFSCTSGTRTYALQSIPMRPKC